MTASKNCNCPKLMDTYAIIELNLIKNIDTLQYEKNHLIEIYEDKVHKLEEELQNTKILQSGKIQLLSEELVNEKIINHELKNELKVSKDDHRCDTLKKKCEYLFNTTEEPSKLNMKKSVKNLDKLLKDLFSKISSTLAHEDEEIWSLFNSINLEINTIRSME